MPYIADPLPLLFVLVIFSLILLLFPSVLAYRSKSRALDNFEKLVNDSIKKGKGTDQLDELTTLYATATDVAGISASTRMTIATVALLIIAISLFSLISFLGAIEYHSVFDTTNMTLVAELANYSESITQLLSIVLGILGAVLAGAVGFYFGSQTQTSTETAAKGLEEARLEVERQIRAAEASKKELEKFKTSTNLTPTANAGTYEKQIVGSTVKLDGSASRDPDKDELTYIWTAQPPKGSSFKLDGVNPTFVPDQVGEYRVTLIVNDGIVDSAPDTVTITVTTKKPTVVEHLQNLHQTISKLDISDFEDEDAKTTLKDNISAVVTAVHDHDYKSALETLQNDLIKKTDGCATSPEKKPDKDDLIKDCKAQGKVYPELMEIVEEIKALKTP